MLKIHWNTLKISLFSLTTKQLLSNLRPEILEYTSNFEGWGLTLVAYKKRVLDKNSFATSHSKAFF